jgi:hypothetical protein
MQQVFCMLRSSPAWCPQVQKVAVDLKAQWEAMTKHACSEAHSRELQSQVNSNLAPLPSLTECV